jgi:hypothetical protein
MTAAGRWPGGGGDMARRDPTREKARYLRAREALLAELYGRCCELAIGSGDLDAARRWNREYRLSAFRCRTLGALVRSRAPARGRTPRTRGASDRARSDIARSEHVTLIDFPRAASDPDRQIDELLDRIRALVFDRGVLEADGASDIELRANRQAIRRSRERLALLVKYQQSGTAPPAA